MADQPYQSLYRRYRPQRFDEVRGQDHVTRALRNAVRDNRVAHAYLFSGPRGTGKTSTARILAKALNCAAVQDGEPCGVCDSCVQVPLGSSLDVFEIDAASNRGIDSVRELIGSAMLGSPGRWKVYIVDEVHMLSKEASAALLKTLEEPPAHVVFVLATTDPQKVLPTIRSRTQHYEFRLLPFDVLVQLVKDNNADAKLGLDEGSLEVVARRAKGSARDAQSILDQVAASGDAETAAGGADEVTAELMEALCERDAGRALAAVARGCSTGRDPRVIATDLLEQLREAFLAVMAPELVASAAVEVAADQGRRLGAPGVVRAMDAVGQAVADMREALEPRVSLEVALVRVARPDVDASPAALLERIERLERQMASGVPATAAPSSPATVAPPRAPAPPTPGRTPTKAAAPKPKAAPAAETAADSPAEATGTLPTREELTLAWGDAVLKALPSSARARTRVGRFISVEDGAARFALPNKAHLDIAEPFRHDVEEALASHFGVRVPLRFVVDEGATSGASGAPSAKAKSRTPDAEPEIVREELVDATTTNGSAEDVVRQAFPGAEEVAENK